MVHSYITMMLLILHESELPRILRECRNAMAVGLRSLVMCMAYLSVTLQYNVALGGDNVILATLIDVSRRAIRSHEFAACGGTYPI